VLAPFDSRWPIWDFAFRSLFAGFWVIMPTLVAGTIAAAGLPVNGVARTGGLEWVLARPVSRATIAAAFGAAANFALLAAVGIGFAARLAVASYVGRPGPEPAVAAGWWLLASTQMGVAATAALGAATSPRPTGRRVLRALGIVAAGPLLLSLPALEYLLRGEGAALPRLAIDAMPWLATHAPLALLALAAASALAHALAYRRFRSLEL
ncbi:MAG TPA: hypothetical protein VNE71_12945, partial [Myxococcota bacterium]|nr:hypothetical protein [Myxococcota bacterium]